MEKEKMTDDERAKYFPLPLVVTPFDNGRKARHGGSASPSARPSTPGLRRVDVRAILRDPARRADLLARAVATIIRVSREWGEPPVRTP
jgi:hypothetical protein